MTTEIDMAATYKFFPLEHCVNVSSGGFPQLAMTAVVSAVFDENIEEWTTTFVGDDGKTYSWRDLDMQTTFYLVLCNTEKHFLNYEQAMRAFGWAGDSFATLNDMDLTGIEFLGQVRENDYNGKVTLRVEWIDSADADPHRSLKRLDSKGIKDMDAKFGNVTVGSPAKAPAKAPGKSKPKPKSPPKPKSKAKTAAPSDDDSIPFEGGGASAPPPPAAKGKVDDTPLPFGSAGMTKNEAWALVHKLKKANVLDGHIADSWMTAAATIAGVNGEPPEDEEAITPEQWRDIAAATLDAIPHEKF